MPSPRRESLIRYAPADGHPASGDGDIPGIYRSASSTDDTDAISSGKARYAFS
jgi:hypothetical protein